MIYKRLGVSNPQEVAVAAMGFTNDREWNGHKVASLVITSMRTASYSCRMHDMIAEIESAGFGSLDLKSRGCFTFAMHHHVDFHDVLDGFYKWDGRNRKD